LIAQEDGGTASLLARAGVKGVFGPGTPIREAAVTVLAAIRKARVTAV